MMHSTPMPLMTALDMVKRLHLELVKRLTPEQQRDLARLERLIAEAQREHAAEVARLRNKLAAMSTPAPARKRLFA